MQPPHLKLMFQNLLSLFMGQSISLILNFLSITFMARYLGVDDFGRFNFLLAIVMIAGKITDFGFVPTIFREASIEEQKRTLINSALTLRIIVIFFLFIFFNIIAYFFQIPSIEIILINLLSLNIIFSAKTINIRELLELPFRVNLKMIHPMLINTFDNLLLLIGVFLVILLNGSLVHFIIIYVAANIPGFIMIIILNKRIFNFKFHLTFDKINWLIKQSFPIYIYIITDILFQQLEILFLKKYQGLYDVGTYSAGLRLVAPLLILPSAIVHTIFPLLSKNFEIDKNKNMEIISFVIKALYFFAFVIAALFTFKGTDLVQLIFGASYINAKLPATILLWGQIFTYINFFIINLFVADQKQLWILNYSLLILFINIIADFLLVPSFSYTGASIAKFISVFSGSIFVYYLLKKFKWKINFPIIKNIIWSVFFIFALYMLQQFSLFLFSILSLCSLVILTFITRFFSTHEIELIKKIIKKN